MVRVMEEREKVVSFADSMRCFLEKLGRLLNGYGQPHSVKFKVPELPPVSLVNTGIQFAHFLDDLVT